MAAYVQRVFFDSPWSDAELPSLVHEQDGAIPGFMGVVARPWTLRGETLRGATSTQLMVEPARRGIIGIQLLQTFLRQPHDIVFSDAANPMMVPIWEKLGGQAPPLYAMSWTIPLRRLRSGAASLGRSVPARGVRLLGRPVMEVVDRFAGPPAPGTGRGRDAVEGRRSKEPSAAALRFRPARDVAELIETIERVASPLDLRATYTRASMTWLVERLKEKPAPPALLVLEPRDAAAGGVALPSAAAVCVRHAGAATEVLAFHARPGEAPAALAALVRHEFAAGAVALTGRYEPTLLEALESYGARFTRDGPWTLVHARRSDVLNEFLRGRAHATRLDGERWASF